jgi:hypothetical protein
MGYFHGSMDDLLATLSRACRNRTTLSWTHTLFQMFGRVYLHLKLTGVLRR